MRMCILGAGGLGSVLGGWLSHSGVDVTLVGRQSHVNAIRQNGLEISGIRGSLTVSGLTAVTSPEEVDGEFDYVMLAVKAAATHEMLTAADCLRDRIGVAFSVQNTVSKEDELVRWIGRERVIGASTIEGGTLQAPGIVAHTASAPTTAYFGELDGSSTPRVDDLVEAFNLAGFSTQGVEDIYHVEWEKLLQIAVVAGWSASIFGALGGSVAQGLVVEEAAQHYVQLATELLSVYQALGYEPADYYAPFSRFRDFASWTFEEAVEHMTELGVSMCSQGLYGRPSLHDDLLAGRPTEVEYSLGRWLKEADGLEIAVPTAVSVYRIVKSLEHWLIELGGITPVLPQSVP
jgi:2-dehydropantoate 2-reductase